MIRKPKKLISHKNQVLSRKIIKFPHDLKYKFETCKLHICSFWYCLLFAPLEIDKNSGTFFNYPLRFKITPKGFETLWVGLTKCPSIVHSVEISWFFYHSDSQILREINIWKYKICQFGKLRGSEFWFLWIFAIFAGCNLQN